MPTVCVECKSEIPKDFGFCNTCCLHSDIDEFICLDCGRNFQEDLTSMAYEKFKDHLKYGDL